MEEQKQKMEDFHWFMLYLTAVFFDFCGWVFLLVDIFLLGWAGFILNIFAGMTFILWALIWSNKGLGVKFFITLVLSFFVEIIPIVGSVLPTWTFMIYRAKLNYQRGSSITSVVSGKVAGGLNKKIAGSALSDRQKYWATRATRLVGDETIDGQAQRPRTLQPSEQRTSPQTPATPPLMSTI